MAFYFKTRQEQKLFFSEKKNQTDSCIQEHKIIMIRERLQKKKERKRAVFDGIHFWFD